MQQTKPPSDLVLFDRQEFYDGNKCANIPLFGGKVLLNGTYNNHTIINEYGNEKLIKKCNQKNNLLRDALPFLERIDSEDLEDEEALQLIILRQKIKSSLKRRKKNKRKRSDEKPIEKSAKQRVTEVFI
jgi:hypothetical protein